MPFLTQSPIGNDYRSVEMFRCPSYPDKDMPLNDLYLPYTTYLTDQFCNPFRCIARHNSLTIFLLSKRGDI